MPRLTDSSSEPHDFCAACFPSLNVAESHYDDVEHFGEGPDGRGNCFEYGCEHPPYSMTDYCCEDCGEPLTDDDE